jgi:hypothetical protein
LPQEEAKEGQPEKKKVKKEVQTHSASRLRARIGAASRSQKLVNGSLGSQTTGFHAQTRKKMFFYRFVFL